MSAEECEARRTVAYQLSAYEGRPRQVQVAAAAALEAIEGKDAETAAEAMSELWVTVYEHCGSR
ncbi:hypothetical protein ACFWBH_24970 [Streptomyces sp. NPDC059999]|uniref:hypothetical protein n=1 Tax=Streptomyces sp. NPDC059999 TaxID=3347030 RepID=UPI0036A3B18F